ncbi:TPA: hypothetical protein DCL30_04900 [Candidatus Peribacteria bacterium]|nr:MAG: hypothetical protein A3J91_04965 [Candidatus Peribacteria bacterium RIFOXYC2_FULL_58_10]OGJ84108.1 MAG: hypothetical protein A2529_04955 [Candidatus Peribacteria bacterium RIFOXYD2_FULL_58_15]HAI98840.1 hypothetical protein [Candidatus Peribacteria bacterium]HAS34038.1 hypothetical protein [Candidatus Peribacteria bacterium]
MPSGKKKPTEKKLKRGAIPHLFLVLGFFGAALTTEVVNIMHEFTKSNGAVMYGVYSIVVVFIAWPWLMIQIMKAIEHLYSEK